VIEPTLFRGASIRVVEYGLEDSGLCNQTKRAAELAREVALRIQHLPIIAPLSCGGLDRATTKLPTPEQHLFLRCD